MAEAAQAIESRQILPAPRMVEEKAGRPGESRSLMDEWRIAWGGCAISRGVFADVFMVKAVDAGVEFSVLDNLPAIKLTNTDTGARIHERARQTRRAVARKR
jgi:hypothetical protein